MSTRKKSHKESYLTVTNEYEQCDDGEVRLQKIFEFLLADEIKSDSGSDS